MPIDIDTLLGIEPIEWDASWSERDVILYHLGIGAGVPATDEAELRYTYEAADLRVVPSFGTVPGFLPIDRYAGMAGLDVDLRMLVHVDHELTIHGPIPTRATAVSRCRPVAVWDKRVGASVVFETSTEVGGATLFTNTMHAFIRGEGDYGGDAGPTEPRIRAPKRDADAVVETPTLEQQALLYRLSGDYNPLHADPEFAAAGGFERPILHGLCTYGIACKAAVGALLGGETSAVKGYTAKFSGAVIPGDTLTHSLWHEDDGIVVETRVGDRSVLKQARLQL